MRGAKRLTACCTIPPSGCRPAVPESRLPSRPKMTMWALTQVHGGPSPVAPTRTTWIRALVLPASWPSPPCAKATAGTVARISDRAMTMCLSFKLSPLLDPADAAAPEPSESAHPGYLKRIGFPSRLDYNVRSMIRSFADRATEDIFDGATTRAARRRCPPRPLSSLFCLGAGLCRRRRNRRLPLRRLRAGGVEEHSPHAGCHGVNRRRTREKCCSRSS